MAGTRMIDRRNEVFKALAEELLAIQQGSVEDAIALLEDGNHFLTDEEFEQVRIYIEELGKVRVTEIFPGTTEWEESEKALEIQRRRGG